MTHASEGTGAGLPPELEALIAELDAAERDARALVDGLDEAQGAWREAPGSWSVAECLDHLAVANRVYLAAMAGAVERARARGRMRRGPARPGLIGRWFVRTMEPPVKMKIRTARVSTPRVSPPLGDALDAFVRAQNDVRAFVRANADLDLARIHFPNPFAPGVRFSVATGLHVVAAHERRHLWQGWKVRSQFAA